MITSYYSIVFNFQVENSHLVIPLMADVELHHSRIFYVIRNFRTHPDRKGSILPDLRIKKKNGQWVHLESEKETYLSVQIGQAIDTIESNHRQSGAK